MGSDHDSIPVKLDTVDTAKATSTPSQGAKKPRLRIRFRFSTVFGLLFLSYILGAAVMFFQFPTSGFLSKGFMGVRAWAEKRIASTQSSPETGPISANTVDQPGKTFDGFTLYACASPSSPSTRVFLINMQRQVVHQWSVSFSRIWPNPPHLDGRQIDDSQVSVFACHLYTNGDLLVVFHSLELHARGYGLAKVDKDSNLIWSYAANVHHDVTVGEDGTIYTLVHRQIQERPKGLEYVPLPWFVDYLVMLSPDGKELREPISIFDALRNSPYTTLLSPLESALNPTSAPVLNDKAMNELREQQDVLHTNSVNVLTAAMAPKFPKFKAGQVLLSMRNLHAIAVLDPTTSSIVWGACGPWHYQHDAQFLDNGHLMIFDNVGSPRGSRVLEYDLQIGSFPWVYPGVDNTPFLTPVRGMAQRLPNGNTLIVNSDGKEMFEVTQGKEVVWTCATHGHITTARRYSSQQLSFLKVLPRPRI